MAAGQHRLGLGQLQQGTQRHVVLSALGCTSWQNVLNYASVLDLVPSIQQLVDDKSIPLQEALRIGRETAAKQEEIGRKLLNLLGDTLPKAKRKLSARDVAKARGAGAPVAILLQYGHGTGTGGYVVGRDFINPAVKPVMDQIAEEVWKVVTS